MTDRQHTYDSDAAFRRALADRLRTQAQRRGRAVNQLRREFAFQRFLARVFADPDAPWVLKGGAAMLARLPDARHSRDVDLYHPGRHTELPEALPEALAELTAALDTSAPDRLRFVLESSRPISDDAADLPFAAYVGATVLDRFTVYLTLHLRPVAGIEHVRPPHVLDLPGLPEIPRLRLYPVHDQLADKICSMYARYGEAAAPSSRYRDLVDIVLVLRQVALDARELRQAVTDEALRRHVDLPVQITLPGSAWTTGYRSAAVDSPLPRDPHDPTAAIALLATCVQPVLERAILRGTWDPMSARWQRRK
ncbi:MAG TPA: nucleotidyl transferase AbiEii/AbiGii toxin family protein [Sporichthyaceae bacterium]|jgi:predicted nucleotidyltransferase component of viral defense system|nr:nucleotidyl transferase AbiEii/AbiGii toxin family protein [Sporichthyaceae bacterium]